MFSIALPVSNIVSSRWITTKLGPVLLYVWIIAAFPFSWGRLGFHLSCNHFLWRTNAVSNHIWGAFLRVQKKSAHLHLGTDIWLLLSLKKVTSKILPLQLRNRVNPLPSDPNTCNQPRHISNDQNPFLLLLQNKTSQSFSMSWEPSSYPPTLKTCIVISSQYSTAALCLCAKLRGRKPIFLREVTTETRSLISYSKYLTKVLHEKRTLHTWFLFSEWMFHNSYY